MPRIRRDSEVWYIFEDRTIRRRNGSYAREMWPEKKKYPPMSFDGIPPFSLECPSCGNDYATPSEIDCMMKHGYCFPCKHYNEGLRESIVLHVIPTIEMIEELFEAGLRFEELFKGELHVIYEAYQKIKKKYETKL